MNSSIQFAWMIGMPEAFLILAVILILFGAKKLPELAKGMGEGIKEFRKAGKELNEDS
jgi:sec-independent protein translocase protein TatA